MVSNLMKPPFDLARSASHLPFFVLFLTALVPNCFGQAPEIGSDAPNLLRWPEEQQLAFVASVLERGFPEGDGDKFSFLLVNRSGLVVPQLEMKIENELHRSVSFR
jgi:hypothetical protein